MKKIISTILACVLLLGCVMSLASCSETLIGEYEADMVLYEATYEFKVGGKVILTIDPVVGDDKVYVGKYTINSDTEEITFVFEAADAKEYAGTRTFAKGEENGEKYIKMNGIKYTLED